MHDHLAGLLDHNLYVTHNRRPVVLVYIEEVSDIASAISREKQIKGWTRRKKEALMQGDYERLSKLSRGHPSTGSG